MYDSDDEGLKPPYPDEFDALRIGTAINADTNLRLAHEASQYGTVLPSKDETTGECGKVWR